MLLRVLRLPIHSPLQLALHRTHTLVRTMTTTTPPHDTLARLPAPLRTLVLAATKESGSVVFGTSEADRADVARWIARAAQDDVASPAGIKELDAHLVSRTYVVSNALTAADVALYGALHPTFAQAPPAQVYAHPALTRYFDHIQTRPPVRAAADAQAPPLGLVAFDLDGAPRKERGVEPPKKKEKGVKPAVEDAAAQKPQDGAQGKKEKALREKKEAAAGAGKDTKKEKGGSGRAPPAPAEPATPVPSMIDLRVGHIVDVKKHPDADGLYVEQIDIGEETGPRTVVSGLVNYIPIEQMRDRRLIAVCNLKPASMRGVKSFAMVLCATAKEGREGGIEIIDPPADAKPGDRVYFEGAFENDTPLEQLNPKKKIFETIQPGFITLESREAAWVDPATKTVHRIRTKTGVCTAPSFVGASLS